MQKPRIGIIMGSDSDLSIMSEAAVLLEKFSLAFEITIVSAHRTPEKMLEYAKGAKGKGLECIIAGAGGAAHLPGMIAALTTLPVIGVPIRAKNLEGLDSLLSIVQMPFGVPVGTVAINGAKNAALLAIKILSIHDSRLYSMLKKFQNEQKNTVLEKAVTLESKGFRAYIKQNNTEAEK